MEAQSENLLAEWAAPECPFRVAYSPQVLDDIRLAVTDAFFSLPRGGAEIGGLLLGRHEPGRVVITDSLAIECEHATGPSFVLSDRDRRKLSDLLAQENALPEEPVGWWHSHTRTEIFLSDADQAIHNTFFPEAWQVALVLKPHTFLPMRAGFFFRDASGAIHGESTYREFTIEPLPMRPIPTGAPAAIDVAPEPESPPPGAPEPALPPAADVPPPAFLATEPPPPRRWTSWLAVLVGIGLGVGIYQTAALWLPHLRPASRQAAPQSLALSTIDRDGQLQIRWNGDAPVARSGSARLVIVDGGKSLEMPLDAAHLKSGATTYARASGQVDVMMILKQPDGSDVREATTFTGEPLLRNESGATQALPTNADESARLRAELAKQVGRNRELEKAVEELRKVVQREQQRRLGAQLPDMAK